MHRNLFPFLGLFATSLMGCLEHTYRITPLPESGLRVELEFRGDPMDFLDDGQLFPDSSLWQMSSAVVENDKQDERVMTGMLEIPDDRKLNSLFNWQVTPDDSVHLQRNLTFERRQHLFGTRYSFKARFSSREFNEKYGDIWSYIPAECRLLDDPDSKSRLPSETIERLERQFAVGIIQWNRARFERLMDRTWRIVREKAAELPDTSATLYSIAKAGWVEDIHQYLNNLEVSEPNFANLEWWSDLRPIFLGRLVDLTGTERLNLVSRIADNIHHEYEITQDIQDDRFVLTVQMPGWAMKTNGKKGENGLVSWDFEGKSLWNEDQLLQADSFEPSIWRIGFAAALLILLLRIARHRRRGAGL